MENRMRQLISSCGSYTIAVGAFGHVHTWGLCSLKVDSSEVQEEEQDSVEHRTGYCADPDTHLPDPVYFRLEHPFYDLDAYQVSCSPWISAVIARERVIPDDSEESTREETLSSSELDRLVGKIRKRIQRFANSSKDQEANRELFKSKVLKRESFVYLLREVLEVNITEEEIDGLINTKGMAIRGRYYLDMNPFFKMIEGTHDQNGFLFVMGRPLNLSCTHNRVGMASYSRVDLPNISCKKVACGANFIILLSDDNYVYSWGRDRHEALGPNSRCESTFQLVDRDLNDIIDICCGDNHVIALSKEGRVYSWGRGDNCVLGTSSEDNISSPQKLSLENISLIRTSNTTSCAYDRKKNIFYVWGWYRDYRYSRDPALSEKPKSMSIPVKSIIDLCLGKKYWVFINNLYQLQTYPPYNLIKHPKMCQVTGRNKTFFSLSTQGNVYSWSFEKNFCDLEIVLGRQSKVEDKDIEDERISNEKFPLDQPIEIKNSLGNFLTDQVEVVEETKETAHHKTTKSKKIDKVACSAENTYLITDQNELCVTGAGKFGQLGINFEEEYKDLDKLEPSIDSFRLVTSLSLRSHSRIKKIACGRAHVLAIKTNGQVCSWGLNEFGQLGLGHLLQWTFTPDTIDFQPEYKAKKVAAGDSHSLVLMHKEDEPHLFSFGSGENGKLGLGEMNPYTRIDSPEEILGLKPKRIACGAHHSLAIENDILYLWGDGFKGQLGFGTKECVNKPREIKKSTWLNAKGGATHTIAVNSKNELYIWGTFHGAYNPLPQPLKDADKLPCGKKICTSENFIIALGVDKNIFYWGPYSGKASVEHNGKLFTPPLGIEISSVSAGTDHAAYVTADGKKVVCWGESKKGRLGIPHDPSQTITFDSQPIPLPDGLLEKDSEESGKDIDPKFTFQDLVQSEANQFTESGTREMDKQIAAEFDNFGEQMKEIAEKVDENSKFFEKIRFKSLNRLNAKPFRCVYREKATSRPDLELFSALILIYQLQPCYSYNLIKVSDRAQELLDVIYMDMEDNNKLMLTVYYLLRLFIKDEKNSSEDLLGKDSVYRKLALKLILSSQKDMRVLIELAKKCFEEMNKVVAGNPNGIDPDPLEIAGKENPGLNKLSAYYDNKSEVNKRVKNLREVITNLKDDIAGLEAKSEEYSMYYVAIVKDLVGKIEKNEGMANFSTLNIENLQVKTEMHKILSLLFKPLNMILKQPGRYGLAMEIQLQTLTRSVKWLRSTLGALFKGTPLAKTGERWLQSIDHYLESNEMTVWKPAILKKLLDRPANLDIEQMPTIYEESLRIRDRQITASTDSLNDLLRETVEHSKVIRMGDSDALSYIAANFPDNCYLQSGGFVNLHLKTRMLLQDQEVKKCRRCHIFAPPEMVPKNSSDFINVYQPIPAGSLVDLYTRILRAGPRRFERTDIKEHLDNFKYIQNKYMRNYANVDIVTRLYHQLRLKDSIDNETNRTGIEKRLIALDSECIETYKKRKTHSKKQDLLYQMVETIQVKISDSVKEYEKFHKMKQEILFNVEYGASNRELEKYTDGLIFKVFLNKIRTQVNQKPLSVGLFVNLNDGFQDELKGFSRKSLKNLKSKKIVTDDNFSDYPMLNNVYVNFELSNENLHVLFYNSLAKFNICGRDEFRNEEVIFQCIVDEGQILKMRKKVNSAKKNANPVHKLVKDEFNVEFSIPKLLELISKIEDSVSAYHQRIVVAEDIKDKKG